MRSKLKGQMDRQYSQYKPPQHQRKEKRLRKCNYNYNYNYKYNYDYKEMVGPEAEIDGYSRDRSQDYYRR